MNTEIFQNATTDASYAKAYGEYLDSCADNYSKLLNNVSEVVSIDVEDEFSDLLEQFGNTKKHLINNIRAAALAEHIDLANMQADTQEYKDTIKTLVNNDAQTIQYITDNFNSPQYIIDHPADFLSETVEPEFDTIDDESKDLIVPISCPPPLETYYKPINSALNTKASELCTQLDVVETASLSLKCGYTTYFDLIKSTLADSFSTNKESGLKLTLTDIKGNVIDYGYNRLYTFNALMDDFKSSMASCYASAAAFKSLVCSTVSDRVTTFTSLVSSKVSELYQNASNFINSVKTKLVDASMNVKSFANWFMSATGWEKVTEDWEHLDGKVIADFDFANYTGAAPNAAVDYQFITDVGAATTQMVAIGVSTLFKKIGQALDKAFQKFGDKMTQIFDDPYDIGNYKASDSGIVDGFASMLSNYHLTIPTDSTSATSTRKIGDALADMIAKWYKFDLLVGEIMFRVQDFTYANLLFDVTIDIGFKPRSVKADVISSFIKSAECNKYVLINADQPNPQCTNGAIARNITRSFTVNNVTYDSVLTFEWIKNSMLPSGFPTIDNQDRIDFVLDLVKYMKAQGSSLYETTDSKEYMLYQGFQISRMLLPIIMRCGVLEMLYTAESAMVPIAISLLVGLTANNSDYCGFTTLNARPGSIGPETITNTKFVLSLTDHEYTNSDALRRIQVIAPCTVSTATVGHPDNIIWTDSDLAQIALCTVLTFIYQKADKKVHPADFAFVPYLSNVESFSDPQYYVKTDEENMEYSTKMVTLGAIFCIAAVVGVTAGALVGTLKRRKQAKLMTYVGGIDNATWNGVKPSTRQLYKYNRYTRKLDKLTSISNGVTSAAGAAAGSLDNGYLAQTFGSVTGLTLGSEKPNNANLPSKDDNIETINEVVNTNFMRLSRTITG